MMMSFIMATLMAMPVQAQDVIEGDVVEPQDDTEVTDSTMLDSLAADTLKLPWPESVQVGIGKRSLDWFAEKMATPLREGSTGPIAPQGLTLEHIEYPEDDQLAIRAEAIRAKRTL